MTAVVAALKKTTTKTDGGIYTDALHAITAAKVSISGPTTTLSVRLSMFKDQATLDAGGESALDESFAVDVSDPVIAGAFATLRAAILAQAKASVARLAGATNITVDIG